MRFCASAMRPVSARFLITSFCESENWTPARDIAVMPRTGSLSALPTMIAELCRSVPSFAERSSVATCARSNWSPATLPNVSICCVTPVRISSSPNSEVCCNSDACAVSCSMVRPATPPVDRMPFSTAAIAFACLSHARTDSAPSATIGAVT